MSIRWSYHDQAHLVPLDSAAESALAGAAIVDRQVALWIWDVVGPDDIYDHRILDVIEAATRVPPIRDADLKLDWLEEDTRLAVHGCIGRAEVIAEMADVELSWLVQLVTAQSGTPVESLLRRVIEVADARRCIAQLVDRLDGLDVDVTALVEADARRVAVAEAVIAAAAAFGRLLGEHGTDAAVVDALIELGDHAGLDAGQVGETIAHATREDDHA